MPSTSTIFVTGGKTVVLILPPHIFPSLNNKTPVTVLFPICNFFLSHQYLTMKVFKHGAKLKEFYNKCTSTHHLNYTINYVLYHVSIHSLSILLPIQLVSDVFQSCRHQHTFSWTPQHTQC